MKSSNLHPPARSTALPPCARPSPAPARRGRWLFLCLAWAAATLGLGETLQAQSADAPSIPLIRNVAYSIGQPVSPVRFFTYSRRVPNSALVLSASSSNPGWLPDSSLQLSGLSSNRVLTLSPAPATIGSSQITIRASDGTETTARTFSFSIVPGQSVRQVERGWTAFANHLVHGKNLLSELIPVPLPGTWIYRWNPALQGFDLATFDDLDAQWTPDLTLAPGDGAFIYSPGAQTIALSGVAQSVCPSPDDPCPITPRPETQTRMFKSSPLPVPSTFEDVLGFGPLEGDQVMLYDGAFGELPTQPSRTFIFSRGNWLPQAPVIDVGVSAFFDLVPLLFPPTIVTPPVDQHADEGDRVTLTVVAVGSAPLSYQWYKDATAIPDATGPSLVFSSVSWRDEGSYRVDVSNPAGSAGSPTATLTIDPSSCPSIFCPTGVLAHCSSPTGTVVRFEVGASNYCNPASEVIRQCYPESGSVFHTGDTPVVCRAASLVNGRWYTNECSFTVRVLGDCPTNSCLDLAAFPDGLKPNPWELPGYKFQGLAPDGASYANNLVGPWGELRGLVIRGRLDIELTAPASVVTLAVSNNVICEAYDASGGLVDRVTSTPWATLAPETVSLRSLFNPIVHVRLLTTQELGLLVSICCERYQFNGITRTEECQDLTMPQDLPNPWPNGGLTWKAKAADGSLEPNGHIDPAGTAYPSEAYAGYRVEFEVELRLDTPARRVSLVYYEQSGLVDFVAYDEDGGEVARQRRLDVTAAPEHMDLVSAGNLIRTVVVLSPNARCKIQSVCLGHEKEESCLGFTGSAGAFLPNPLIQDGVRFTSRDASGLLRAFNTVRSIGGEAGLQVGPRSEIELPIPADRVDLSFRGDGSAMMAEAFNTDGRSIDSTVLAPGADPATTITLRGGVNRILLSRANTNAILTRLCLSTAAGDPSHAVGPITPISSAPMGIDNGGLIISNLSDALPGGVSVNLGGVEGLHLRFTDEPAFSQMPTGAFFRVVLRGRNGEMFGSVKSMNDGSSMRTEMDFESIGSPTYRLDWYQGNQLGGSMSGASGPVFLSAIPSGVDADKDSNGQIRLSYSWANGTTIGFGPNAQPQLATRLEIVTERTALVPLCLCRVDTLWMGIHPRTLAPDPLHCLQVLSRDIDIECAPPSGTPVTYSVRMTNLCNHTAGPVVNCSPASGSSFPVGRTPVLCFGGSLSQPVFGVFYVNVNTSNSGCLVENGSFEMADPAPDASGRGFDGVTAWTAQGEAYLFGSDARHFPACQGLNYALLRAQQVGDIYKEGSLQGHLMKSTPIGKEYRVMACVALERGTGAWIEILISDGTPGGEQSAGFLWVMQGDWTDYRGSVTPTRTCDRVIVRTVREHDGIRSDGNVRVDNIMVCCGPLRLIRCGGALNCVAAVWSGEGVLQGSTSMDPAAVWSDLNLPVTETSTGEHRVEIPTSPNLPTKFFRLRAP